MSRADELSKIVAFGLRMPKRNTKEKLIFSLSTSAPSIRVSFTDFNIWFSRCLASSQNVLESGRPLNPLLSQESYYRLVVFDVRRLTLCAQQLAQIVGHPAQHSNVL